jgi:hypothetical protein
MLHWPQFPIIQGPTLGSALQTAFQLGNASSSWLGIFASAIPLRYLLQSPVILYAPRMHGIYVVAGWSALPHRVFSSPPAHTFSV